MEYCDIYINFGKYIFYIIITIFLFTNGIYFFLKYPPYQKTYAKTFIILFIALLCAYGVKKSIQYSETLWEPDPTHELITLNSANTFAEKGLTSNYGLPDFSKSYYYVDRENNDKLTKVTPADTPEKKEIYTHLPSGPYLLAGVFVKVCGNSTLVCPRILSVIMNVLAMLFFAIMLYSSLGPLKSVVLLFFVAIIPMTTNMVYTLHYANYTFSLFIIQIGLLLYIFKKNIPLNIFIIIMLFILGFIQGWFSYEYFFPISLSSLPLAILYSYQDMKTTAKRLLLVILFLVVGYCFAFILHFIQNSLFFGSTVTAFQDLFSRGEVRLLSQPKEWKIDRIGMTLNHFFVISRSYCFFIINFPILLSAVLVLIWFKDIKLYLKDPINIYIKWVSPRRNYLVILTGFLTSFLWIFVMFNHAAAEVPHLPRILFFFYFICILTVVECIQEDNA